MPAKKFRFVSPGVQIKEIDKSQLPRLPVPVGPVVIGRTLRGPGMLPVTVSSYEEFVEKFGTPDRGAGSDDVWRNGNTTAPTYAAYAAEAYLRNSSPLTMVRLLGTQDPAATDNGGAGWTTTKGITNATSTNGGAYGLFVVPSSSAQPVTGCLAAIFYLDEGNIRLVGDDPAGSDIGSDGASALVANIGSSNEFRVQILDNSSNLKKDASFNFNVNSSKYIRKVFNTNPTLVNDEVTPEESLENYWLGETFATFVDNIVPNASGNVAGNTYAFIAGLATGSVVHHDFKDLESTPAKTGWVIGQDLNFGNTGSYEAANMPKLFRLVAGESDTGSDWEQNNIKVSIFDINPSPNIFEKYGTFSVGVRRINDTDANPEFVEVFTGCNLNPNSPNYVAAKIGDRRLEWDSTERRHKELGDYPNVSRYIRVEMNPVAEQGGLDPELLPFGFFGPTRFKTFTVQSGSAISSGMAAVGSANIPYSSLADQIDCANVPLTASIQFPSMPMLADSENAGTLDITQAYFGMVATTNNTTKLNEDLRDLTRIKPDGVDSHVAGTHTENSFVFSLDDIVVDVSGTTSQWVEGSRKAGDSYTTLASGSVIWRNGVTSSLAEDNSYKSILDFGHDRFTMPLFGGFDGLDVVEREPFRNTLLAKENAAGSTEIGTRYNNYALSSLYRAIDSVRDPEVLEMNLLVLPGITNRAITKYAIDLCEQRADALAIIDLEGGYQPSSESPDTERMRIGSVTSTVDQTKSRNLNSSFGCAYYPWVKVLDSETGFPLWMPPSIAALGTMASSQENTEVWFAPAGFNRGGLSVGSSGLSVVGVREKLTSKQRDSLYEVSINPIASFPNEGIVIFGQKTLQAVPSALDRINVRRLVIFLKKEISRIAARLLFEPNVSATWNRFKAQAEPLLEGVKSGFGIAEYRLVLDETTTTPEEIDRNMMYAKLFIKPVYAIEFIGIDFIITNTGASFEDL
mgnify:FL=1